MAPFKLNPQTHTNTATFFPSAEASSEINVPWYKFVADHADEGGKLPWEHKPNEVKNQYPPNYNNLKPYIRYVSSSYNLGAITLMDINHPIATDVWLAMDGEWHSVGRFPVLVKRLEMKQQKGQVLQYFIRRGNGFCLYPPSEEHL